MSGRLEPGAMAHQLARDTDWSRKQAKRFPLAECAEPATCVLESVVAAADTHDVIRWCRNASTDQAGGLDVSRREGDENVLGIPSLFCARNDVGRLRRCCRGRALRRWCPEPNIRQKRVGAITALPASQSDLAPDTILGERCAAVISGRHCATDDLRRALRHRCFGRSLRRRDPKPTLREKPPWAGLRLGRVWRRRCLERASLRRCPWANMALPEPRAAGVVGEPAAASIGAGRRTWRRAETTYFFFLQQLARVVHDGRKRRTFMHNLGDTSIGQLAPMHAHDGRDHQAYSSNRSRATLAEPRAVRPWRARKALTDRPRWFQGS